VLRQARHLTQDQLAEAAGVAQVSISKIELGKSSPRASTLLKLAHALGCSLEAIVGEVVS